MTKFHDAQWLLIEKAEKGKLLQVTIKLPDAELARVIANFKYYYLRDFVGPVSFSICE